MIAHNPSETIQVADSLTNIDWKPYNRSQLPCANPEL